jgi:trans-AT polyketide synthase, acyltransferase and oxidoreductase domains
MSTVCMFPGQGSHSKGMGRGLFDRFPDWTSDADAILGYSIRELCLDDPNRQLGLTRFTQPALFVINAMTYRAREERGEPSPSWVAGHSLGEYNALLAAQSFDFVTGLRLVQRRGQIMSEVGGGGMAAVIGLDPARIQQVLDQSDAGGRLDIANFNSFDQTVLAGPADDLATVKPHFEAAGVRAYILLNVSAPFHSRYMRPAQAEFSSFLSGFELRAPAIPVISNVTGKPYDPSTVHDTVAGQIGHPVRWLDSILFLLGNGATDFQETGPGSVLTKLVAQIKKKRP